MDSDPLMKFLAISTFHNRIHEDVFVIIKAALCDMSFYNFRIYYHVSGNVQINIQDGVHRQECFGNADSFVGGIVQRPFQTIVPKRSAQD